MLKNINKRVSLGTKTEKEGENDYIDMTKNYCEISHPFQPQSFQSQSFQPQHRPQSQMSQSPLDDPMKRRYFDELMTQKQYHTGEIARINTEIYAKFGIPPS